MKRRPIIIDCDPGHDDAMAILWALASEELEIKAITTVAGNQTIEKVTNNAIRVLTKAKKIRYSGSERSRSSAGKKACSWWRTCSWRFRTGRSGASGKWI